jgi:hypothetical protein
MGGQVAQFLDGFFFKLLLMLTFFLLDAQAAEGIP